MLGSQTAEYKRDKRHFKRAKFIALFGGKCAFCGSDEKLEFDHIDPSTKVFMITGYGLNYSEAKILEEAQKCQLLCRLCHREKTDAERRGNSKLLHGDITMYTARKCRCEECSKTNKNYQANYRRMRNFLAVV